MADLKSPKVVAFGDLVLLITNDNKSFLFMVQEGKILHTHKGKYQHDELVGKMLGSTVSSQVGQDALLMAPSIHDMMTHIRRGTQIVYPKDAAYIVHRLSLRAGSTVIEAGTGSGALTTALAWSVAPTGKIYTYEAREDNVELARKSLGRFGLLDLVETHHLAIDNGFLQSNADALVLDLREPWLYLDAVHEALCPGGHFACLMPTTNQVSKLLDGLERAPFASISVEELMLRTYKPVPDRLRPEDEMVGHTGYMVFARTVAADVDQTGWLSRDRKRYRGRQKAAELNAAEEARRAAEMASGGRKYPKMPLPG